MLTRSPRLHVMKILPGGETGAEISFPTKKVHIVTETAPIS